MSNYVRLVFSEWARSCSLSLAHSLEVIFEKKKKHNTWQQQQQHQFLSSAFKSPNSHFTTTTGDWLTKCSAGWLAWPPLVPLTLPMCCRASGDDSLSLSLFLSPEEIVCCRSSCHVRRGTRFHFIRDFGRSGKLTLEGGTLERSSFFSYFFSLFLSYPSNQVWPMKLNDPFLKKI
jgi:hypothetical protein